MHCKLPMVCTYVKLSMRYNFLPKSCLLEINKVRRTQPELFESLKDHLQSNRRKSKCFNAKSVTWVDKLLHFHRCQLMSFCTSLHFLVVIACPLSHSSPRLLQCMILLLHWCVKLSWNSIQSRIWTFYQISYSETKTCTICFDLLLCVWADWQETRIFFRLLI